MSGLHYFSHSSLRCDCPRGYRLDTSGKKCVDENECVERPRICGNGTCTNVDGGFDCACTEGFAPGPFGNCEDVDECTEYGHQCAFRWEFRWFNIQTTTNVKHWAFFNGLFFMILCHINWCSTKRKLKLDFIVWNDAHYLSLNQRNELNGKV